MPKNTTIICKLKFTLVPKHKKTPTNARTRRYSVNPFEHIDVLLHTHRSHYHISDNEQGAAAGRTFVATIVTQSICQPQHKHDQHHAHGECM